MNSLSGQKIWYSVTIHIDLVPNRLNSSGQIEYCSYLVQATESVMEKFFSIDTKSRVSARSRSAASRSDSARLFFSKLRLLHSG